MDLFKKLQQQSHEVITHSYSNIFLIPKTKSTFSCISDTNVTNGNIYYQWYYYQLGEPFFKSFGG